VISIEIKGNIMRNILRLFIAPWYLLGWLWHIYLVSTAPGTYQIFGETALIPGYADFWQDVIMSNIILFIILLATFELIVGILLIYKGKWVKLGLGLSIAFNLFLVQMGLGYQETDFQSDFLLNRLPNIIFVIIQLPLLWGNYKQSISTWIQNLIFKKKL
jgi:hypothetical protein